MYPVIVWLLNFKTWEFLFNFRLLLIYGIFYHWNYSEFLWMLKRIHVFFLHVHVSLNADTFIIIVIMRTLTFQIDKEFSTGASQKPL